MALLTERKQEIIETYRTHGTDTGSPEVQVAILTTRINDLIGHFRTHKHDHHSPGWKPYRDWRVWAVVLMLIAMAVYVLTMNESLWPGGGGPAIPAPGPAADAP